jgi:hypothetical protein
VKIERSHFDFQDAYFWATLTAGGAGLAELAADPKVPGETH